ncbi:MAG: diguanylate cyclase (GGDEF)-like protein [Patiriisocius sp.]|jgi:diguanylate cyclase (GGDEF)-like protein
MFDNQIIIFAHPDSRREAYEIALKKFEQLHFTSSAVEGLQFLESSPAHVAFIESDCEEMTGIEIAEAIRDIDDEVNHFTYICLVSNEATDTLIQSAVDTVDSHVPVVNRALVATAMAGNRLAIKINDLARLSQHLQSANILLLSGQLLDPLTGLGNRKLAEQSLNDSIRQIESRGGAVCVLMLAITNFNDVIQSHNQHIADELVIAVSEKINSLVRPLDIVSYCEQGQFTLILVQPGIENCTAECYKRLYDGVGLKSYATSAGFLPANIAMSICASHALNGPASNKLMFDSASADLKKAALYDKVVVTHLTPIEE